MIYQYSCDPLDSNMYILIEGSSALVIDPCISKEAENLIENINVADIMIILTHEHFDHISGVKWFQKKYGATVLCSKKCAARITDPSTNLSQFIDAFFVDREKEEREQLHAMFGEAFSCKADRCFEGRTEFEWMNHIVSIEETPGHSPGSCCILIDDNILFSGDSLIPDEKPITRLPGSNKKEYHIITIPFLESLCKEIEVFPGHKNSFKMSDIEYLNGVFCLKKEQNSCL